MSSGNNCRLNTSKKGNYFIPTSFYIFERGKGSKQIKSKIKRVTFSISACMYTYIVGVLSVEMKRRSSAKIQEFRSVRMNANRNTSMKLHGLLDSATLDKKWQ